MNKILFFCTFFFILIFSSFGQENKEKISDIKHLLVLSGSEKNVKTALHTMISMIKNGQSYKNTSEEFWVEFEKELDIDELLSMYIPIYDKHYSHNEIKDMITFYQSETGKKMVEKMPLILTESMELGSNWGKMIGKRAYDKLNKN